MNLDVDGILYSWHGDLANLLARNSTNQRLPSKPKFTGARLSELRRLGAAGALYDFTSRFLATGPLGAGGGTGLASGNGFAETGGNGTCALATVFAGRTDLYVLPSASVIG